MKNYFTKAEEQCPCCKTGAFVSDFRDKLNKARAAANVAFVITSGFRCPKHNAKVGGKPNSAHLAGLAADILTSDRQKDGTLKENAWRRQRIIDALRSVGFTRIGIARHFVHVDDDLTKPQNVTWLY